MKHTASKVETQADLQKEAKISDAEARKIALKRVPGTIESGELEREFGKLIYSFDIKVAGKAGITEVAVNAIDGKIVNVSRETPAKEAAEKKQEAKEKTNATATTTRH
ncbi:MAG: PepSY domain-containing protein [Thermoanaerobaculia bacterium]